MRNVIILHHFHLLWVDDDQFHVAWGVAVKQGGDESISHDGLTRTSSTGDQEVRHFGKIGNDWITRNIFTNGKAERVSFLLPFVALEN